MQWSSRHFFCEACEASLSEASLIQRELPFFKVFSLLHYDGFVKEFIQESKNAQNPELTRCLARHLAQKFKLITTAYFAGVIPMPARQFGTHDHAYLVAEEIAGVLNVPIGNQFIERAHIEPQKSKNMSGRERIKFKVRETAILQGHNEGVWLLVDDVITSGFTLHEAYRALGLSRVVGLTLASVPQLRGLH